jgi:hypothetical protein
MESLDKQSKSLLSYIDSQPYQKYTLLDLYPIIDGQSMAERDQESNKIRDRLDYLVENGMIREEIRYYSIKAKF